MFLFLPILFSARMLFLLGVFAIFIGQASLTMATEGKNPQFVLTAQEREYLDTLRGRPIEISYSYDLVAKETDGLTDGMLTPLLGVLKNELGLNVNLRKLDWREAFIRVESGEVDYYGPIALSAARQGKYVTVDPFYRSYSKIVSRVNDPLNSMRGLYNRKIGLLDGSIITRTAHTYLGPNGQIVYFPTMDEMIAGLKNGRIDAFATVDNAEFEILPHDDIQYEFSIENFYVDQGFISGRQDIVPLSRILNRYLKQTPQITTAIVEARRETLLRGERRRLANIIAQLRSRVDYHEILIYADMATYPLCYWEKGAMNGMQLEINQIFEELTGIKIRFGTDKEFPEGIASALAKLKTGECMAFVGGYYDINTWNDPDIQYSPVLWTDTIRAYSYREMSDLLGKQVGVMPFASDYIGWNNITGNNPIVYNSYNDLTTALKSGNLDAVFMGESAFNYSYTVLEDYILREIANVSADATMHMLYSAQNKEFNVLFDSAISLFEVLEPKSAGIWKSQSDKYKSDYIRMRYTQELWAKAVGTIFSVMLLTLFFMLARNKQAHKKTASVLNEVAEKNRTIVSSINYASIIQKHLLPAEDEFKKAFTDHSIIWNPKDVVGGDIYWLKNFEKGAVLCVCDCTGHGVPGAMLTMLVTSTFESAVNETNCQDTAQIIWELEKRLTSTLNVEPSKPGGRAAQRGLQIRDGCDIAVLYIGKDGAVKISAANLRVYLCDGREVTQIKGQKIHIGDGTLQDKAKIEIISIPPNPANKFYIASDGFYEQIGGKDNIPFGYGAFKRIILENHNEPQSVISEKIWQAFEDYRGGNQRRDDFELITFKP